MSIRLLSELLLKNDDSFTWLSLTNNEIGIPVPELTDALLQNLTLRKVSCHAGFLGSLSVEDFELLLTTLSQLSHLRDLWLALPAKQAWRSSGVLQSILGSPKMSRLQKLTFRGTDDNGCLVVARELKRPVCSLIELQIRGATASSSGTASAPPSKTTRRGILAMAEMLQVNQSLERLDLCYKGLDVEGIEAIARAIAVNQKLQKLELSTPNASPVKKQDLAKGYNALAQHMRQNYTLHHLNTPAEGNSKYLIELLTKLNRTGVRALMRNTTDHTGLEDVLEILQENNKDISSLFEILATNPTLWDPIKANARSLAAPSLKERAEKRHNPAHSNSIDCSTRKKQKQKPVMARWNENIFSTQEREKIKNFKRWTPTIIDNPPPVTTTRTTVRTRSTTLLGANTPANRPFAPVRTRRSKVADNVATTLAALEGASLAESDDTLVPNAINALAAPPGGLPTTIGFPLERESRLDLEGKLNAGTDGIDNDVADGMVCALTPPDIIVQPEGGSGLPKSATAETGGKMDSHIAALDESVAETKTDDSSSKSSSMLLGDAAPSIVQSPSDESAEDYFGVGPYAASTVLEAIRTAKANLDSASDVPMTAPLSEVTCSHSNSLQVSDDMDLGIADSLESADGGSVSSSSPIINKDTNPSSSDISSPYTPVPEYSVLVEVLPGGTTEPTEAVFSTPPDSVLHHKEIKMAPDVAHDGPMTNVAAKSKHIQPDPVEGDSCVHQGSFQPSEVDDSCICPSTPIGNNNDDVGVTSYASTHLVEDEGREIVPSLHSHPAVCSIESTSSDNYNTSTNTAVGDIPNSIGAMKSTTMVAVAGAVAGVAVAGVSWLFSFVQGKYRDEGMQC